MTNIIKTVIHEDTKILTYAVEHPSLHTDEVAIGLITNIGVNAITHEALR